MKKDNNNKTQQRKIDHLKIALSDEVQIGSTGFEKFKFVHNALPEIDYDEIDTSTTFLNKKVDYPFFISCMTGGVKEGRKLNRNLAKAAQKYNIAMGVGSQRAAIENEELEELFQAREVAPDIPLMANIGVVQLNYGFGWKEFQRCVDMIEADALVVHINPIQEIIQPEGDKNWSGLLKKLEKVVNKLDVPVIAKEVGFGLSDSVVERLYNIGIKIFDTAGWGGTNWSLVEGLRGKADENLGRLFSGWGIPTSESIVMCGEFKAKIASNKAREDIMILGSGGIRNGVEIAKAIRLGADMVGIATPFAQAARKSSVEVEKLVEDYAKELKTAMFGIGANEVSKIKKAQLLEA